MPGRKLALLQADECEEFWVVVFVWLSLQSRMIVQCVLPSTLVFGVNTSYPGSCLEDEAGLDVNACGRLPVFAQIRVGL